MTHPAESVAGTTYGGPTTSAEPLRPGDNPLADQLIEENSRLRRERNELLYPDRCLTLHVTFMNGQQREYPIHGGGDWSYREEPNRIIVRPRGSKGFVRHEIPLFNVASVMIAPARIDGSGAGE